MSATTAQQFQKISQNGQAKPEKAQALKPKTQSKPKPKAKAKIEADERLNTTKSVWVVVVASLLFAVLFYAFTAGASEVGNNSARILLDATFPRWIINVAIWGSTILLGILYIFLFNNELWRYWHTRITTKKNFTSDFYECKPYERLSYLSQQFWAACFLFALLLLVIFS